MTFKMKSKYINIKKKLNNNFIPYLILDRKYFNFIYITILYNNNNIYKYIYILNFIYIFFIKNSSLIIYYLLPIKYKYIFLLNNYINNKLYELILNIIGVNYKFYYLLKYNILIFQLKYSHKIIIKLPILINCKININKNLIYLYSTDIIILKTIGKMISLLQRINKYKELGINFVK
uniref:Large subunit ribosomal protein 6 n=1 Tax=Leucocytozoon caulleryi TaxID=211597 RepID=U3TRT4_LEUCU|nr:large subunit ribosomal protein 6 [Leucocytozoon caulleryi]BAN94676.1 large subunit ribosomal protein 6 [Leucocytozoon caulleryi]